MKEQRMSGSIKLGAALTAFVSSIYILFILSCAFAPAQMARALLDDGGITLGLAFGLAVIATSVAATVIYVHSADRRVLVDAPSGGESK